MKPFPMNPCGSRPLSFDDGDDDRMCAFRDDSSISDAALDRDGRRLDGVGGTNGPEPKRPTKTRPLTMLKNFIGECICDVIPVMDCKGLSPTAQFVQLHGLQHISLGAVEDELTPRQRIADTLEQLASKPERLISIGYLVDDEAHSGTLRTESIPLEVWMKAYPNDTSMSKPVSAVVDKLKSNQFGAALESFRKELENQKRRPLRDNNYFRIGISAHNVGVVSILARRDELVVPFFQIAVNSKRDAFGPDHPEVAVSLDELGIQHFARAKFEDALVAFSEARRIRAKNFGPLHPKVVTCLNNIGCCNYQMGNHEEAMLALREAVEAIQAKKSTTIAGSFDGGANTNIDLLYRAILLNNLGYLKISMKKYDDARLLFEEASLIQHSAPGDAHNHRALRDTRRNLEFTNAFHS